LSVSFFLKKQQQPHATATKKMAQSSHSSQESGVEEFVSNDYNRMLAETNDNYANKAIAHLRDAHVLLLKEYIQYCIEWKVRLPFLRKKESEYHAQRKWDEKKEVLQEIHYMETKLPVLKTMCVKENALLLKEAQNARLMIPIDTKDLTVGLRVYDSKNFCYVEVARNPTNNEVHLRTLSSKGGRLFFGDDYRDPNVSVGEEFSVACEEIYFVHIKELVFN
jgi:hypothetical protein